MEQVERTERYLLRIREVYDGTFAAWHDRQRYEDDLISFFLHCYHIKDWVAQLNVVGVDSKQLNAFINAHEPLQICADLANGSKHCKLLRQPRSGRQPHISLKTYKSSTWLTGSGGGEVVQARYSVLTSSGFVDALELAEKCMSLWRGFIVDMEHHA